MRTQEVEELFVEPPRRTGARRLLLALAAFLAVAMITLVAVVTRNPADPLAQLRIRDAGVAVVHGTNPERTATEGQDLEEGDVVRTNGTGHAQIDLFDGSLVRLDSDSEVSLRELSSDSGSEISLGLLRGRTWNRVADLSGGDSYTVGLGEADVTAVGTTFMTDCSESPTCYVLGVEGVAVVNSSSEREVQVERNDCVEVSAEGRLSSCDPEDLIDAWVRENLAEDEQLIAQSTASPSPSPSPTVVPGRRRAPAPAGGAPGPAATPVPTARTDEPDPPDTPEPTIPRRTKKPTPDPTPPDETPFDGGPSVAPPTLEP